MYHEYNIKMSRMQTYGQDSYGLIMGPAEGTCKRSQKTFTVHKMLTFSYIARRLLRSQTEL